jgi:hypothetical protein
MRDEKGIWLVNKKTGDGVLLAKRQYGGGWGVATDHIWQDLTDFLRKTDASGAEPLLSNIALRSSLKKMEKAVW